MSGPIGPVGPVALVGSGEFLPVMEEIDRRLLEGRPARAVYLPTAAGEEGDASVRHWLDLGRAHFERLDVEPVPLEVVTRADAESLELAGRVAGAGLVYLSGGNPGYLAATLRSSPVLDAILAAWRSGAALAGCSAGACALSAVAEDFRHPDRYDGRGFAVVGSLAILPHFDRIEQWRPDVVASALDRLPDGLRLVGIDEETALVCEGTSGLVAGEQSVWEIADDGRRTRYGPGERVAL